MVSLLSLAVRFFLIFRTGKRVPSLEKESLTVWDLKRPLNLTAGIFRGRAAKNHPNVEAIHV
jgi:hypothetical protein